MTRPKIRVLLDLSLALRGYSGIPQDVRLLYKTLACCDAVDVTGFVYPSWGRARRHRFARSDAPRGDRLANQACFLWNLSEPPAPWPALRPWRLLKKLQKYAAIMTARTAQFDPLDVVAFSQVLWRTIFSQTLSPDDLSLVQNGKFLLMNVAADTMHRRVVANRRAIKIDTRGYDFLIVQTARPLGVSAGTRRIVRYHDMIPVMEPDTALHTQDIKWHHHSIRQTRDAVYVCNSEPTRQNLNSVYPELAPSSTTIPYMLSEMYHPEANGDMLRSIIGVRRSAATGVQARRPLKKIPRYIMSVSTLEPRKNFDGLIQAFNAVRSRDRVKRAVPNLKLLIVGSPGWKFEPIVAAMREFVERGDLIHLESVTSEELRVLYSHAEAFVFPSHAEGFGFPPLEAMQCDVPVIASDIPEHRWVLDDAALYCNSYDIGSIAGAIERLLATDESHVLRADLVARGRERAKLYSLERCSRQWLDLLHRLKEEPAAACAPATTKLTQRSLMERAA